MYGYDGSVTGLDLSVTSPINLPTGRKVVIFVTGANLYLNGGITYNPGESILVVLASLAISIAYPLLDGVYSDIVARMGKEKNHLIGLTSSTINISYVVWPPIAGFIFSPVKNHWI